LTPPCWFQHSALEKAEKNNNKHRINCCSTEAQISFKLFFISARIIDGKKALRQNIQGKSKKRNLYCLPLIKGQSGALHAIS
jgi:hypothetical protein